MGTQSLVILGLDDVLVCRQLRLDVLLPLLLAICLYLGDAWSTVGSGISPRRREDGAVECVVVRACDLDVRSSICVVVRL